MQECNPLLAVRSGSVQKHPRLYCLCEEPRPRCQHASPTPPSKWIIIQTDCHRSVSNSLDWLHGCCYPSSHHDKCPRSFCIHTRSCFWCHSMLLGVGAKGHALNLHMPRWGEKINFNAQRKKLLLEKVTNHYKLLYYHVTLERILQKLDKSGKWSRGAKNNLG